MLIGMVLIPYEFHGDSWKGPRWQRAYAHQDGAHTLRILRIYRMDRDGRGHMRSGMVVIPYEFAAIYRLDRDGRRYMLTGMVLIPYEFHKDL